MKKFKVYVPVESGFLVEVEADSEDSAIEKVMEGEFDCPDSAKQIIKNHEVVERPTITQ